MRPGAAHPACPSPSSPLSENAGRISPTIFEIDRTARKAGLRTRHGTTAGVPAAVSWPRGLEPLVVMAVPRLQAFLVGAAALVPRLWSRALRAHAGSVHRRRHGHVRRARQSLAHRSPPAADTLVPPGYPLLLALAQALAPSSWATVIAWTHAIRAPRRARSSTESPGGFAGLRRLPWRLPSQQRSLYRVIFYEGLLLSETTFTFAVILGLWLLLRASEFPTVLRCLAAGLALGTAAIVHANYVLMVPLSFLRPSDRLARRARSLHPHCGREPERVTPGGTPDGHRDQWRSELLPCSLRLARRVVPGR